jgi:putative membrane protein
MSGRLLTGGGLAAFAIAFAAMPQTDQQAFLKEAVQRNLAELRLGELASQRAENAAVRDFGRTIRQDHHAAVQRASNVARSLKAEAPTEPTSEAKRHYDGLAQLSGSQFDAAFVSYMIVSHEAEIANYSSNAGSDNDAIAGLVAEALPTMKAHLAMAQALQRGVPPHASH